MGSQNDDDWFGSDNKLMTLKKGRRGSQFRSSRKQKVRHSIKESKIVL